MTFWSHTMRKALKPHRCDSCGRVVDKGEIYTRQFGADGNVWTYKECAHCTALVGLWRLGEEEDGYGQEAFTDYDCNDGTDLRWRVQWGRQWRRRDGTLYPIPEEPAERIDCARTSLWKVSPLGSVVGCMCGGHVGLPIWRYRRMPARMYGEIVVPPPRPWRVAA